MNRIRIAPIAAAVAAATLACGGPQEAPTDASGGDTALRTTAFSDQFNGYDSSTWEMANWANGNPFNCGFRPDHVTFSGGTMTLKLDNVASSGKSFSGGEYRTKDTFSYGKYEVRMKAARGSGTVSSFFTYTGSPWDEIDVEILGKNPYQVQFNYYVNGQGGHERVIDLGFDSSAGFHTYAIDWQPNSISWYVDGQLKHTASGGTLPSHASQIMMNLWNGIGVDGWLGSFNYSGPLYASYDYVSYTPSGGGGGGGGGTYTLSVSRSGSGTVTSNTGGINCGSSCSANFNNGTNVTLTASAASGSTFGGWGGACSGTNSTCVVYMNSGKSVSATFNTSGGGGGGGGSTGSCKAVSGGQSGNFNTTGAVCFTVNAAIHGWGCSNVDGRSVTVNGTAVSCGKLPLPGNAPYTFSFSGGSYSWASFYWW